MTIIDIPTTERRKKLDALEAARRRYVQALYSYLPCLAMPDEAAIAIGAISLVKHIAEWHESALVGNVATKASDNDTPPAMPETAAVDEAPLTQEEKDEIARHIVSHGIYAAKDPDTGEITVTHSFINGVFHPLNERELLEVARDIAAKAGGA